MLVNEKRLYTLKTLREKSQAVKDLEKEMSNKGIAAKYGVRSNTLSTWVKNKEKLLNSLEKESNTKL